jgi:glycosyltransferase involved in cell wall biosynthesis
MRKLITILVPAYNEAEALPELLRRLRELARSVKTYDFEFLFVNDGSVDGTLDIIKKEARYNKQVSYIDLSRNFGKEIAIKAGIDHVDSDALITIDADLQDPPELIPRMIKYWEEGYDDIYARRTSRNGESLMKKLTSWGYFKVLKRLTKIPIQENTGDFRLLDRRCVEALRKITETDRNTKALYSWIGFRKKEVTYVRPARANGKTKYGWGKMVNHAIDGITSFTTAPLRIASVLGFLISLGSFIYIVVIIINTLIYGSGSSGYPSTISVILFLGGVQLIGLGIIGEYIARIFNEAKNRPLYFTEEVHRGRGKNKKS